MRLTVVPQVVPPAAEKVRSRLVKQSRPACVLQCRCGAREFIEARTGVEFYNGRARGGTKVLLCAACYMRGQRVVV
jgi:hypothetical protein